MGVVLNLHSIPLRWRPVVRLPALGKSSPDYMPRPKLQRMGITCSDCTRTAWMAEFRHGIEPAPKGAALFLCGLASQLRDLTRGGWMGKSGHGRSASPTE
jgi:hypothetical protein